MLDHNRDCSLTITYPNGNRKELCGSLAGGVTVGKMDLTEYIRNAIPIEGLAVFDSINFQEE